jgi:hypothetical protein
MNVMMSLLQSLCTLVTLLRFWQQQQDHQFRACFSAPTSIQNIIHSSFITCVLAEQQHPAQHNNDSSSSSQSVGGSSDMAAAPPPQPAACRLVAADELGVLKGASHTWQLGLLAYSKAYQPASALCAVIEVPAGPKWDAAAVVTQW